MMPPSVASLSEAKRMLAAAPLDPATSNAGPSAAPGSGERLTSTGSRGGSDAFRLTDPSAAVTRSAPVNAKPGTAFANRKTASACFSSASASHSLKDVGAPPAGSSSSLYGSVEAGTGNASTKSKPGIGLVPRSPTSVTEPVSKSPACAGAPTIWSAASNASTSAGRMTCCSTPESARRCFRESGTWARGRRGRYGW